MFTNLKEFMEYVKGQIELGRDWVNNSEVIDNMKVVCFKRNDTAVAFNEATGELVSY